VNGINPSLFFDDNSKAYISYNSDRRIINHYTTVIEQFGKLNMILLRNDVAKHIKD
jgi:beta-xylosidase